MIATRLAFVALSFFSYSSLTPTNALSVSNAGVAKRQDADILAVLTNLQSTTNAILPQIGLYTAPVDVSPY